jgi:hypothetical protein
MTGIEPPANMFLLPFIIASNLQPDKEDLRRLARIFSFAC